MRAVWGCAVVVGLVVSGCFGARSTSRNYFVMHGEGREKVSRAPVIDGLVRVRNMDTDAVYDKFQIVVRRSPYQLRYSDLNVWAVRPNKMVADLVAQTVQETNLFSAVTRDLLEARPEYTLSGRLHALEVYDSEDLWFAHLQTTLHLSRFSDGKRIWSMEFDERKRVTQGDFGHAARALSELLQVMLTQAVAELADIQEARSTPELEAPPVEPDDDLDDRPEGPSPRIPDEPVLIPERPAPEAERPPEARR